MVIRVAVKNLEEWPNVGGGQIYPLRLIIKGCNLAYHENALLREEVNRLRAKNQIRNKKKQVRRSYIAHRGLLYVEEGRQLALEKAGPIAKSAKLRLCSNCKLPSYIQRKCPGIQDSIHVHI